MMIKKCRTALTFHGAWKAMSARTLELEHVTGVLNSFDFITKVVDNTKFSACAKAFMFLC